MAMIAAFTLATAPDEPQAWGVLFAPEFEVTISGVGFVPAPDFTTIVVIEPPEEPAAVGYAIGG